MIIKCLKSISSLIFVSFLSAVLLFTLTASGCETKQDDQKPSNEQKVEKDTPMSQSEGTVEFSTAGGSILSTIDVEIADTPYKTAQGLMFRERMENNHGMIFIFEDDQPRSFWMKNTVLALDMVFVNSKMEIVTIHKNTTPYSEQTYPSTAPAKYVIEVNAGYTDQYKITVGGTIRFER
jgi:uncharacterized membrane protein (UPF0127 family)